MNLNSLITGPARLGLTLGSKVFDLVRSRFGGVEIDDATLKRSVEAEVLASRRAPKGKVEIEVVEGVVWMRGEVRSKAAVDELETRARSVDGVARVESLLRVAKPAKRAKPAAKAQKPAPTRSSRPKPAAATAPPPEAEPAGVGSPAAPFPTTGGASGPAGSANGASGGELT